MADVLSPENLASTAEALQSNPQSVAIRTPNEAEDFMARIGRTAASTFSPALQGVAQLEGNQGAVDYFRNQRLAQNTNQPGDLIPTNPELDNSVSATIANTIGSAGPRAGLLALTGGAAGMGLLAGETLAQNYALVPEQQAIYDEAVARGEAPEGERPTMTGANVEGLGTLAAFAGLGPAAGRLAMPAIASVRPALRPLAGVGVNALSNVAMDLGIRAGTSAVTGHPIVKDANDLAAIATGGAIFGLHPGIEQARGVPAWQQQQQTKAFIANLIKAKKMEADALEAAKKTEVVVPNTPPPENTVIKPATEDETGVSIAPPKDTPPLVPTAALDPSQTLIPNAATAVENTSTKGPEVVVTPKVEATEPAKAEAQPSTPTETQVETDPQKRIVQIDEQTKALEDSVLGDPAELDAQSKKIYDNLIRERIKLTTGQEPVDLSKPAPVGTKETRPDLTKIPPPFTSEVEVPVEAPIETVKKPAVLPEEVTTKIEDLTKLTDDQLAEREVGADPELQKRIDDEYDRRATEAGQQGDQDNAEIRPSTERLPGDQRPVDAEIPSGPGGGVRGDEAVTGERGPEPIRKQVPGLTPEESAEYWRLVDKPKLSKEETDRLDSFSDRIPQKPNWNGEDKSGASLLIRRGNSDAGRVFQRIRETTSPFADLAAHLADNFPELMNGLKIKFTPDLEQAFYDPNTHTMHLGEKHLTDVTIFHEAIHGLTVNVVEDALNAVGLNMKATGHDYLNGLKKAQDSPKTPRAIRDLIGQYFHALKALDKNKLILGKDSIANKAADWKADTGVQYGAMSLHEFLGEAFTDRGFQNVLNKIPSPMGGTLFSRLIDSMRRVLGVPLSNQMLLARVIKTGGEVGELNTQRARLRAGLTAEGGQRVPATSEKENEKPYIDRGQPENPPLPPDYQQEARGLTAYKELPPKVGGGKIAEAPNARRIIFSKNEQEDLNPGFYSKLEETILGKMPKIANPDQVKGIINAGGLKAEELKWSGIIPWLEGQKGKVTKEQVQDYLRTEGAVKFEEKELRDDRVTTTPPLEWKDAGNGYVKGAGEGATQFVIEPRMQNGMYTIKGNPGGMRAYESLDAAKAAADQFWQNMRGPQRESKFSQYQLPGGENYREVVLTVPQEYKDFQHFDVIREDGHVDGTYATELDAKRRAADISGTVRPAPLKKGMEVGFRSSHFSEQGNYVAHMRINERPDSTGAKGTFIEEIQSDRHQKGREQGYREETPVPETADDLEKLGWKKTVSDQGTTRWHDPDGRFVSGSPTEELATKIAIDTAQGYRRGNLAPKVPDAPYRKDWGVQMFKRALRDAIAKGQDWVGWTKGITQVGRYTDALRKVADRIQWEVDPQGRKLFIVSKDGEPVFTGNVDKDGNVVGGGEARGKPLADVIGKEPAAKIIQNEKGDLRDKELTVGGEGMKGFYDTILPNEIGKYVKQWGGKVEEGTLPTKPQFAEDQRDHYVETGKEAQDTTFHKVAITPEMREAVSGSRQPLFSKRAEEGAPQENGQSPKPFLQRAFDTLNGLPFIGKTISKIADSKIVGRIKERLDPKVQDLRESIESKFRGMEFIKNNFATQVRKGIEIAFNHNKADMEAAYPILEAGGGRIGQTAPTDAEFGKNEGVKRELGALKQNRQSLKDQLDVVQTTMDRLSKDAENDLNTPEEQEAAQKQLDKLKPEAKDLMKKLNDTDSGIKLREQAVSDFEKSVPPTDQDVRLQIQREIDNGKKALASDKISDKAKENIRKYLPAYEKALADFDRLLPGVKRVKEAFDDAFNVRNDAGLDPHYIEDYVARVYEKNPERNNSPLPAEALIGGGKSGITSFDKSRKYDTIMDAMIGRQTETGHEFETPKSFDVADLAANHAAVSMDMASNKLLADTFETTSYPGTNEPLFVPKPKVGESLPPNYVAIDGPFRQPIFVYNQVADLFKSIFGESQLRNSDAGNILLKTSGAIKHGTLALDTFHLSRVMQKAFMEAVASGDWQKVADFKKNMPSYTEQGQMGKYLGALDVAMKDIPAAIKSGMLTAEDGAWITEKGQALKKRGEDGGLLAGKFTDNLWKDAQGFLKSAFEAVHFPKGYEKLEQFNKFTFDRVTKAAMFSAFESRLSRIDKDFPELTEHQRNIKAAKEVNEQFGNIGRAGLLKSRTAQDYAQIFMLAPNWVQSQVMAEARQYGQGARAVFDATVGRKMPNGERERVFRVGNSARFLATTALSVFAANQVINLATRGKPTWENEEEGHKMDAWIPGGKTGFFYSPIALASEYASHLKNYGTYESLPSSIAHIASNKLSPLAGAAKIALTQKDYTGKKLSGLDLAKGIARQAAPIPIIGSSAIKGLDDESKAGTTQQNLLRSAGISTERAPDAVARGYQAFAPYRTKERPDMGPSEYKPLKTLVQNGESPEKIKAEVDRLVKAGKKLPDIKKSFEFKNLAGSYANDLRAIKEKPELKKVLEAAKAQKKAEADAFRKALQSK